MGHILTATLSNEFTLSIPKVLREKNKMQPGQKFQIVMLEDKIEFIPIKDVKSLRGLLSGMNTDFERESDRNG